MAHIVGPPQIIYWTFQGSYRVYGRGLRVYVVRKHACTHVCMYVCMYVCTQVRTCVGEGQD